jgi:hypothetical protein
MTRTNSGKQTGLFLAQLGEWNLRQTSDGRYKVAAISTVTGKANYVFGVKENRIDTHAGMDCSKLYQDRIELYKAVEEYFKAQAAPKTIDATEDEDPYGDIALSRNHKLSPEQNWRRGLLQMRRIEFERAAVQSDGTWPSAVRMLWAAMFGTKITDADLDKALVWITHRKGGVDLKELLRVEREYYAGKFAPHSSVNLEAQLDLLAGANEFENLEEDKDNGTFRGGRPEDGGEVSGRRSESEQEGVSIPANNTPDPTEEDPFAAFR